MACSTFGFRATTFRVARATPTTSPAGSAKATDMSTHRAVLCRADGTSSSRRAALRLAVDASRHAVAESSFRRADAVADEWSSHVDVAEALWFRLVGTASALWSSLVTEAALNLRTAPSLVAALFDVTDGTTTTTTAETHGVELKAAAAAPCFV
jgi:hypothetical protein